MFLFDRISSSLEGLISLHTSSVTAFSLGSVDSFVLWVTIIGGLLSLTAVGS